jgi:predicted RNase H-like nuclease (RuvC/YqgF family)
MAILPRKDQQTQPPAPLPPTPRRKVSDDAAHFAQSILDLEERCQRLTNQASSLQDECKTKDIEIRSLREALQQTDLRLQYFERRTTQLETKLETVVQIITDCLKEPAPRQQQPAPPPQERSRATAAEGQLADELPRFLADGPRTAPATD